MLRARDAIDRDYARPLDIPTPAALAHVSPAHFIRTFRSVFGETPHRYLQRRRVERACALLRDTDRSVTRTCHEVGFTSLGTFSRTFRSIMGVSPVSYRRRSRPALVPSGFTMAWTRPASSGNGAVSEKRPGPARTQVRRHVHRHLASRHLRSRPGRGARLLCRKARHGGPRRRRSRLHAVADRRGPRRRPGGVAGAARPAPRHRADLGRAVWTRCPCRAFGHPGPRSAHLWGADRTRTRVTGTLSRRRLRGHPTRPAASLMIRASVSCRRSGRRWILART
ncbi:MAG: helix-turn-helix transcriptional regulator [Micromonosporaceae bacterium]